MRWASTYVSVPKVLDVGSDADGSWLLTAALPGTNAVTDRWKRAPAVAVKAIGEGLRKLHDALPVEHCPFSWSAQERIHRAQGSPPNPTRWHLDHQQMAVAEALEIISDPPPIDQLVVCHGDTCAPNTLIGSNGECTGHVDLEALGTADRWADLAIATWSTTWN